MNPVLTVVATIHHWESKLNELEDKSPERYAEFMVHFQTAMGILASEGIISKDWAETFKETATNEVE